MSRALTPESVGPLGYRPMAPLQQELDSPCAEISNLRSEQRDERLAWRDERIKLCHRIHNGKYKVNRLEGLIDVRENGFKEELQNNVQTIERLEAEIQRLNSSLKLRDKQVELIQRLQKEQEEKMWAQLKEERQKVHELREQLFQASQENLKAVSLSKSNETMLKLTKQQLEQRDKHIMELRREKEGLTQRLIETTTQLQNNETIQKKKRKDLEEENQILKTRVSELEKMNKDLVEKEERLTFRVEEAETAKERVIEKEKTLTDRIQELEEEKRELTHLVSLNKRGFLSRVFQKETEEEKTLRKQLKEKKKELRQLREREKEEEKEQEEEQREQQEEEREHGEEKSKNQDRGRKRVKKGLWTLRKKKNRNTRVEEVAGCSADVEEH
ncbi:trichohyalin-like [Xyrichtys novacula]|uniref:Trichohyalin-like n=1 Tax=Xyrichtys novacula TaxID=13765 RepID=A0AAV1ER36_XYRNO|nr:trichohyalin-like [Xyrichtys novacula]